MQVGDAVQEKCTPKRIGVVKRIIYGIDKGDTEFVFVLWSDGRQQMLPEHRVLRLSCE